MYLLGFISGIVFTILILVVYSCCVVAGRADRHLEQMEFKNDPTCEVE